MVAKLASVRLILTSASVLLLFSSCQLFFDEIGECINKIAPQLPDKTLVYGQVGVDYYESIQAYMKNADDDAFEYRFSISGELPSGIGYNADGRLFDIFGIPEKAGNYKFTLKVEITDEIYGPGDGICFGKDNDKKDYEIVVLE
jgi:hypothetical protein